MRGSVMVAVRPIQRGPDLRNHFTNDCPRSGLQSGQRRIIMTISVRDGSEYFRGLLLLISKDRRISEAETVLMKRIGKALGFDKDFCDNAIQEIIGNRFVVGEPPVFSTRELAMKFIRDGLMLASADDEMHPFEISWLQSVAEKNRLDAEWCRRERELAVGRRRDFDARLEVDGLTVEHSRHDPPGSTTD